MSDLLPSFVSAAHSHSGQHLAVLDLLNIKGRSHWSHFPCLTQPVWFAVDGRREEGTCPGSKARQLRRKAEIVSVHCDISVIAEVQ